MDRGYDIFEKFPDGSAQRHANMANLENAIVKTNALAKLSPNEFYILSTDTQEIVHRSQRMEPTPLIADAEPETV